MNNAKNKTRAFLFLVILGGMLALIATWHSTAEESANDLVG